MKTDNISYENEAVMCMVLDVIIHIASVQNTPARGILPWTQSKMFNNRHYY